MIKAKQRNEGVYARESKPVNDRKQQTTRPVRVLDLGFDKLDLLYTDLVQLNESLTVNYLG